MSHNLCKDLRLKNHYLAKSRNDATLYEFREWVEYFGRKLGKIIIAVPPQYTSQNCSNFFEFPLLSKNSYIEEKSDRI